MKIVNFKLLLILFCALPFLGLAQDKEMTVLWNNGGQSVRGDFVMTGNNAFNFNSPHWRIYPNLPYNGDANNGSLPMTFIDIDNDAFTFQSSSANLTIESPNPGCLEIKKAYLFWSAHDTRNSREIYRNVKFKLPNRSDYIDLVADDSHYESHIRRSYYCRKDVTDLLMGNRANLNGEYTVANIHGTPSTSQGSYAGWSLVVVYEDYSNEEILDRKITLFDGCKGVTNRPVSFDITGFETIPLGQVNAKIGYIVAEGDRGFADDYLGIKGALTPTTIKLSTPSNPVNDFFNSSITRNGQITTDRNPASNNAIGWDMGILDVPNANNTILKNGETGARITLGTRGDYYLNLFLGFSVEVIAPKIELEKGLFKVDANGTKTDGRNASIGFGQKLIYELNFRNVGNDDAIGAKLVDILPANVDYKSITQPLPAGLHFQSVENVVINGVTRQKVTFRIDDFRLVKADPRTGPIPMNRYTPLQINVEVVHDCKAVRDACSNSIDNEANIYYKSQLDKDNGISTEYSAESFNGLGNCGKNPSPTNFFVVDPSCNDPVAVTLCGLDTDLVAGTGFSIYSWTKDGTVIAGQNSNVLKVTAPGTYVVNKRLNGGSCTPTNITETFVVTYDGQNNVNPLNKYANHIDICETDGKDYIQISLCGTDKNLNISGFGGANVSWYEFVGTRPTGHSLKCSVQRKTSTDANWRKVGDGNDFLLNRAGEFALEIMFEKNGVLCPQTYYFRSTKTVFDFTLTPKHILCDGKGGISVTNIPAGQNQYRILRGDSVSGARIVSWTDIPATGIPSPELDIPATYYVQIRPKVADASLQNNVCVYTKEVTVQRINLTEALTVTPSDVLCPAENQNSGSIAITVADIVMKPYKIIVTNANNQKVDEYTVNVGTTAPASRPNLTARLAKGNYKVTLTTDANNGSCSFDKPVTIGERPRINISAGSDGVSCDGKIIIKSKVSGGVLINNTYNFLVYEVTPAATTQVDPNLVTVTEDSRTTGATPEINFLINVDKPWGAESEKTYKVEAHDKNGCKNSFNVKVQRIEKPRFTITKRDADCDLRAGKITINLDNPTLAQTYTIKYAISKKNTATNQWGAWSTYQTINTFAGLDEGEYKARVSYKRAGSSVVCYFPEDLVSYTDENGNLIPASTQPADTQDITTTITQGNGPIVAFVGVSKLACEGGKAKVRVTNISGGNPIQNYIPTATAPYPYQYRVGRTGPWFNHNEFELAPGTHTVYVIGASETDCMFEQQVVVPQPVAKPSVNHQLSYDCEGKGVVTITPQGANASDYDFSYHSTVPTPPAPATELKPYHLTWSTTPNYTITPHLNVGTHNLRVYYRLKNSGAPSILLKEDFGQGAPISSPNVTTAFTFVDTRVGCLNWNLYSITNRQDFAPPGRANCVGGWTRPNDKTTAGANPVGRYMAVDIGEQLAAGGVLYQKEVRDVLPNQPIKFEMFGFNLFSYRSGVNPVMQIQLVSKQTGGVIAEITSREVQPNGNNPDAWQRFSSDEYGTLNPGNNTELIVRIRTIHNTTQGNDFALDDITVFQEPEGCLDFLPISVNVQADKAFAFDGNGASTDATCNGGSDGEYRIRIKNFNTTTGYKYRVLKGTTQVQPTTAGQYLTSTEQILRITGLSAGNDYKVEVRFDDTNPACVKSEPFQITEPDVMVITPRAGVAQETYLDCGTNVSKTININDYITIAGGTPPYSYAITKDGTPNAIRANAQGLVTVTETGTYKIKVTDDRNCNTPTSSRETTFVVKQRVAPTMADPTVSCPTTAGSTITATAVANAVNTSSTFTYWYKKGGIASTETYISNGSSGTFNNIPAGQYTIKASDQYGCFVEKEVLVHQTLSAVSVAVTHKQSCNGNTTPGKIVVTAQGGSNTNSYEYAFVAVGTTPNASQYFTTNEKNLPYSTTDETFDIWVRDTKKPECATKVSANVLVTGEEDLDVSITHFNPTCEQGTGEINIELKKGAAPYTIKVENAAATETFLNLTESRKATTGNTIKVPTVKNLSAGTYVVTITDKFSCSRQQTIALADPVIEGSVKDWISATANPCDPVQADLGIEFTLDATTTTTNNGITYKYLYSINGGRTWQDNPRFTNLAQGTTIQPVIGRFDNSVTLTTGTNAGYASKPELCRKDFGNFVTKTTGGPVLDYASLSPIPVAGGGCTLDYSLPVSLNGITAATGYTDVAYALDSKDTTTWYQATATAYPFNYIFANLIPGRQYTIFVRYKVGGSANYCYASTAVDLTATQVPQPSIKMASKVTAPCFGETAGKIDFTLTGSAATQINYEVKVIDRTTGAVNVVPGATTTAKIVTPATATTPETTNVIATSGSASATSIAYTSGMIIEASNLPANQNSLYYLEVKELPSGCQSASSSSVMIPTQSTSAVTATATVTGSIGCSTEATVTVTATGGTGAGYTYKIPGGIVLGGTTDDNVRLKRDIVSTTNVLTISREDITGAHLLTNPASLLLNIQVYDGNGCTTATPTQVTINIDKLPEFNVSVEDNCNVPYRIKITPTVPTTNITDYRYSIDGGLTWLDGNVIEVGDNYDQKDIRVLSKATGCVSTAKTSQKIVFPAFGATAQVTKQAICSAGINNQKGEITMSVTGGSGSYTYTITPTAGPVTTPITGTFATGATIATQWVPQGHTYKVEIKDTNIAALNPTSNCHTIEVQNLKIDESTNPVVDTTNAVTHPSCTGSNDGVVIVKLAKVTNVQGPYEIKLRLAGVEITKTGHYDDVTHFGAVFTGLTAGNYIAEVVSSRGCLPATPVQYTLNDPPALVVTMDPQTAGDGVFRCDNTTGTPTKAKIKITAQGGTPPYQFTIDGGRTWDNIPATTAVAPFSAQKIYEIEDTGVDQDINWAVKDASGCGVGDVSTQGTHTIPTLEKVTAHTFTQVSEITCIAPEKVKINIERSKSSIRGYTLKQGVVPAGVAFADRPVPNTGELEFDLPQEGAYSFIIVDLDTNCETTTDIYTVAPKKLPTIIASANKACSGVNNIEMTLNVGGFISTGYDLEILKGSVVVYTETNSVREGSFDILQALPAGMTSGGDYQVKVKVTSTGCEASTTISIEEPANPINVSLKVLEEIIINCDLEVQENGIVGLEDTATGGWGPVYEYKLKRLVNSNFTDYTTWSDNQIVYENLPQGTYIISVKDSNGCIIDSNPVTLDPPTPVNYAGGNIASTSVKCFGGSDGTITLTGVNGGRSNYSYTLIHKETNASISTITGTIDRTLVPPVGSVTFTNVASGDYFVQVNDSGFECSTLRIPITVGTPDVIQASASIIAFPDCGVDGEILVEATGGSSNYTSYQRVDAATGTLIGTPNTTGRFAIDHSTTDTYVFRVTDDNGCTGLTNIITSEKVEPITANEIPELSVKYIKCFGDNTGKIVVEGKGGSVHGVFQYEIFDATGTAVLPVNSTGVFENLKAGTYSVKVTKGSCADTTVAGIVITEEAEFIATGVATDVTCSGNNDGKFTISVTSGSTMLDGTSREFVYAISPQLDRFYDNNGEFTDLAPGNYTVIMQDKNGCRPNNFEFQIQEPPVFIANVTPGTVIHEGCHGASDGELKITITGGIPFIDATTGVEYYEVSPLNDTNGTYTRYDRAVGITNIPAGEHKVYVRDNSGCRAFEIFLPKIESGVNYNESVDVTYSCSEGNQLKAKAYIFVDSSVGDVIFEYNSQQTNNPLIELPVDNVIRTYPVKIIKKKKHHKDCEKIIYIDVEPKTSLNIDSTTVVDVGCFGNNDGSIGINVSGGSGNYQYSISPNEDVFDTRNNFSNLRAGFYTISVEDSEWGCVVRKDVEVKEPQKIRIDYRKEIKISCYGASDGRFEYSIEGGQPDYNIDLSKDGVIYGAYSARGVQRGVHQTINNLEPGNYVMNITDSKGCKSTDEFVIEGYPNLEPKDISVYHNCNTDPNSPTYLSIGNPTHDIYVTLETTKTSLDDLLYTLDNEPDSAARPFNRMHSYDVFVIENGNLPDGLHTMKLFYKGCQKDVSTSFEVYNYTRLDVFDVTNYTSKLNMIDIEVSGGKAPYKVYFGSPIYSDPSDIKANVNETVETNGGIVHYLLQRSAYDCNEPGCEGKKRVRVYVEDSLGCGYFIDIDKEFYDIEIPNYFTPNGDGVYDEWKPVNLESYPNAKVEIFDRYGRLLAKLSHNESWNGLYKDAEVPTGDYWYILKLNEPDDERVFKGHFTLYR